MLHSFKLLDQITWTWLFELLVLVFTTRFKLQMDSSRVYLIVIASFVSRFDQILALFFELWLDLLLLGSSLRKALGCGLVIITAFLRYGVFLLRSVRIWLFWRCPNYKEWRGLDIWTALQHNRFFIVAFNHIWLWTFLIHLWWRWFDLFFTQTQCAFLFAGYFLLFQSTDGIVYCIPLKGLDKLAFDFLHDLPPSWFVSVFLSTAWCFAT